VVQSADSRYDFGPLALRLGLAAMQRLDPVQATERALPALVEETGFTALLAVWSNRGPTVVHWQRTGDLVTSLNLGSVLPVARSSLGRMLLAFLPAGVTAEALSLAAKKEKLDREALERELERARKSRLAYADKTVIPGLYATASVVRGWNGEAVCAVVVLRSGMDLDLSEVRGYCRGRLASYKWPAYVVASVTPLPRNATGKLIKEALRLLAARKPEE
jgi:DNA-binding IclR family transcriptional regulator